VTSSIERTERVLILTPVKDAEQFLSGYVRSIETLTYPHHLLSLGLLESDSTDATYQELDKRMPALERAVRRARLWKKDFGYRIRPGTHRSASHVQLMR
jgi:hypothetical protein